tara:strand:+ start:1807 stop:2031 length:225 start_codon:yes stop_codon:yes gene_type:complete
MKNGKRREEGNKKIDYKKRSTFGRCFQGGKQKYLGYHKMSGFGRFFRPPTFFSPKVGGPVFFVKVPQLLALKKG